MGVGEGVPLAIRLWRAPCGSHRPQRIQSHKFSPDGWRGWIAAAANTHNNKGERFVGRLGGFWHASSGSWVKSRKATMGPPQRQLPVAAEALAIVRRGLYRRGFCRLGVSRADRRGYDALFAAIRPDTWVLTPNRRLARVLTSAYNQYQQALGRSCWQAATILAWADAQDLIWQRAVNSLPSEQFRHLSFRLLSDEQALTLWQGLLSRHAQGWDMLKPESLAGLAFSAWQSLQLWCVPLASLEESLAETGVFKCAAQQFELELERLQAFAARRCPAFCASTCRRVWGRYLIRCS